MKLGFGQAKAWACLIALSFPVAGLLVQQAAAQYANLELEQAERSVRSLAKQFPEIFAPTPLESQLQAKCHVNCTALVDSQKGLTVSQELDNIWASKQAKLDGVAAEIQRCANTYIMSLRATSDQGLDRKFVASQLSHVLSGIADQPPDAFVLTSRQHRALLIFDNVLTGSMGRSSSYAALTAFNVGGRRLTESDSTGKDMDGYGGIDVKELPSPVQSEIWLLVSGYVIGANGSNCRMRVYAYDGERFRTVWVPADIWGSFETQVTRGGFVVRGEYYRATQNRCDDFQLTPEGTYRAPCEK